MARSLRKGPFVDSYLMKKVEKNGRKETSYKDMVKKINNIP